MKHMTALSQYNFKLLAIYFVILTFVACGPSDTPQPVATPVGSTTTDSATNSEQSSTTDVGYPGTNTISGYPGTDSNDVSSYPSGSSQQDLLSQPPAPQVDIPNPQGNSGAIGGILVQEVVGQGYLPLDPYELILAEIVLNNRGEPALIGFDEKSLRAETFPTGVFVFANVPPGRYGMVVNTAVSQFPLKTAEGDDLLFDVESGQAVDLGQVFVQLP